MVNRSSGQSVFRAAQLQGRAAVKRQNLTFSEAALWQYLRGSKLGVAFRRQVPIGDYIVDLLASSVRIIVEVDGLWHQRRVALDEHRDRILSRMGYLIVHIDAGLVMQQPLVAVERIREAIATAR